MARDWGRRETRRHQTPVSPFRVEREIFVIRGLRLTLFPHVPRTSPLSSSVFHAACALSAPTGHLPLEGKAPIREYPLLKRRRTTLVIPSAPRIVIPSAAEGSLLHCRHMHTCVLTQTTPWRFLFRLSLTHGLPLCKKDPSTSIGMTGGRRVISHSLSHRFVDPSCAFGAALLQGPTRIIGVTGD